MHKPISEFLNREVKAKNSFLQSLEPYYSVLNSSLNVELVFIILKSITQFNFIPSVNQRAHDLVS